jgi:hypothetical protein
MFSEYCEAPYEVEPVQVIDAFGKAQCERSSSQSHVWIMDSVDGPEYPFAKDLAIDLPCHVNLWDRML